MTGGDQQLAPGMTTIGFIGSGMIGSTVARLSVAAGHRVVLSNSRGPETLRELVAELGRQGFQLEVHPGGQPHYPLLIAAE